MQNPGKQRTGKAGGGRIRANRGRIGQAAEKVVQNETVRGLYEATVPKAAQTAVKIAGQGFGWARERVEERKKSKGKLTLKEKRKLKREKKGR